jgi:hypothetical protein
LTGFRVVLFALAIAFSSSSFAALNCEDLFALKPSRLSQKLIQKIDSKTSVKYDHYYTFILKDAPVNDQARVLGRELLRMSRYLSAYQVELTNLNKLNKEETLELGDLLYAQAKDFLDANGIKYKLRRSDIYDTSKNIFVILQTGNHPLNIEAKEFLKNSDTELVYAPHELLIANSEALFFPELNKISISSSMLVEGSVKKNEAGKHEITHLNTKIYYERGTPYLFHGSASTHGTLPGGKLAYAQDFSFDEMDAHLTEVYANIDDLNKIKDMAGSYSVDEQLSLAGIYRSFLETTVKSGYEVSNESVLILTEGLKNLSENPDSVEFVKKGNYYHASWVIKSENTKNNYFVEIPLLTSGENLDNAELLIKLKEHLTTQRFAAMHYRNIFKVGYDLYEHIHDQGHLKFTATFVKYQKILERKYVFQSYDDVETQKNIKNRLNFEF